MKTSEQKPSYIQKELIILNSPSSENGFAVYNQIQTMTVKSTLQTNVTPQISTTT